MDNGEDLGWPATQAKDMDGQELVLDSDADTSITADTDDRIDYKLSGVDLFRMDGTATTPVNGLDWIASATGNAVQITAVGTDTNISINIIPKGGGDLQVNGSVVPSRTARTAVNSVNSLSGKAGFLDIWQDSSVVLAASTLS